MIWAVLAACAQLQAPHLAWEGRDEAPSEPVGAPWFAAITAERDEVNDGWRAWTAEIDAEPRMPLGLRIALAPINLAVEGPAYLLFPRHVQFNGTVIFDQSASDEDFATIFLRTFLRKEASFLAGLASSGLSTTSVELGFEQPDQTRFNSQQSKVIADSLKRAYRERFNVPKLELDTILGTVTTGGWIDWVVVPAVVSAYTARFGIEKTIRAGEDVSLRVSIAKGTRLYKAATSDVYGRLAAFSLKVLDIPFSAIVVIDGGDGKLDLGFIGIGTDLGAALEAVNGAKGLHEDRIR